MLTINRYLAAIADISEAIFRFAGERLDTQIPACPDWRMRDLIYHIGNIAYFMRACLTCGEQEPKFTDAPMPSDDQIISWAAEEITTMLNDFTIADPLSPAWNWSQAPHIASFWPRCLLHEVMIHGWDVAHAAGETMLIPTDIAADGIDEILTVHLPSGIARGRQIDLPGPIEVHATDTGHRWLVTPTSRSIQVDSCNHQEPIGELTADAVQLYLILWDRGQMTSNLEEEQLRWARQLSASGG